MAILFNGKLTFDSSADGFSIDYRESVKYPNFTTGKTVSLALNDEQVEELYRSLTAHRKATKKKAKVILPEED